MESSTKPLSEDEISTAPLINQIQDVFQIVSNSKYKGVEGVLKIESSAADLGPTVGVTLCTHGNEIAGLGPLIHYLRNNRLKKLLQTGSVIFTINNLLAARGFFTSSSEEERNRLRSIDCNMNRLPKDVIKLVKNGRYEIQRTLELYPVFKEFNAALDIHSTQTLSIPMIVEVKKGLRYLRGASISTVITNMLNVQRGLPVSALYGGIENKDIPVIGIESGTQGDETSFIHATRILQAFLQNFRMIPGIPQEDGRSKRDIYRIARPILFPDKTYKFVEPFGIFQPVEKGQILANGDGNPIVSPQKGHILFPNLRSSFDPRKDEAGFISDQVRK